MGCDIHAHVEIKLADGQWHHWTAPYIDRNYALFTKLAGVRSFDDEIEPFAKPRGLPKDITPETKLARDCYGRDGHSDSWINRKEIRNLESWWNDRIKASGRPFEHRNVFELAIMGTYLNGYAYGHDLPEGVTDVRLVFWFDN